ncbi:MAG: hypothetical protein JKX70_06750 [Phycisphaerales bacterium]|nr:hypothetical protein [Phycisphaerales bacterium]
MHNAKALIPLIVLLTLGSAVLPGCTRMGGLRARMAANELAHQVPIVGDPITVGRLNAIIIDNPYGKVKVYAKSAHEEAHIYFRVDKESQLRWRSARMGLDFDPTGEYFTAVHTNTGELSTLTIAPTDLTIDGFRPPVDLTVYIPQCDGIVVRNAGGKVIISGVTGVINVESGTSLREGGHIEIRTDNNQVESIHATTNNGHVTLVTGPGSAGTIELIAPRGKTSFSSRYGIIDHSMPSKGHWTGIWNNGTNEIRLDTADGDATVMVVENPVMYSSGKTR